VSDPDDETGEHKEIHHLRHHKSDDSHPKKWPPAKHFVARGDTVQKIET
jgi:hypothetical protein